MKQAFGDVLASFNSVAEAIEGINQTANNHIDWVRNNPMSGPPVNGEPVTEDQRKRHILDVLAVKVAIIDYLEALQS